MVNITINGNPVHAKEGATILEASYGDAYARRQFDIKVPCIQFLKGVQEEDESGLCTVEVKQTPGDQGRMVNASSVKVEEGMQVFTDTERCQTIQKNALGKMLHIHDLDCKNCIRTGNCELQSLQWRFRMTKDPSEALRKVDPVEESGAIVRDDNKCVRCGRCVAACHNLQSVDAIAMEGEGMDARVKPQGADLLADTKCVSCGQCIVSCPVGALRERDDTDAIQACIDDPDTFVVVQAAPSVRAAISECFDFPVGSATVGKLAASLRRLGFDRVFDTVFAADLTIMEEAQELIERVSDNGTLPMFTSCCPGWVKFCEHEFPELIPHLSSCKSPQQMFGSTIKSYIAEKEGIPKEKIVVVSAMPCTAKKFELTRPFMEGAGVQDVDFSITARELSRWIERRGISFMSLPEESFDQPVEIGTGAGVIFGATGGVMEAALRTAADWLSGEELSQIEYTDVRGIDNVKEATYNLAGREVKVAAVSGLANARALMDKVTAGEADYAFIEVMACPGGCVNGGGQPQRQATESLVRDPRANRGATLYRLDEESEYRKSHDNPEIKKLYAEYLTKPGSEKAHQLLHTHYVNRD